MQAAGVVAAFSPAFVSVERSRFICPTRAKHSPFVCLASAGDDYNIIELMKNFSNSFQELRRDMREMNNETRRDIKEVVNDNMNKSLAEISNIVNELKEVNTSIGRLSNSIGLLHEDSARKKAEEKFGADFVRKLHAESIHDIVGVVLEGRDDPRNLFEASEIVTKEVSKNLIPLTKALQRTMMIPKNTTGTNREAAARNFRSARDKLDCLNGDEDPFLVDKSHLYDAVALLHNASSVFDREKLKEYFERILSCFAEDKRLDNKKLLYSKGPGISLLEYTSRESRPTNFTIDPVPLIAIDYDMRGRVEIYDDFASVRVGEAKSTATQLRKAKKQCRVRAKVMETTVGILFPKTKENIQKIGHIFIYDSKNIHNIPESTTIQNDMFFQIHIS